MGNAPPRRIQRRREHGWRMPEDAVYVGRPSRWGNPYRVSGVTDAAAAVALYADLIERWSRNTIEPKLLHDGFGVWDRDIKATIRAQLGGKDLCCWCSLLAPCHADVLLEIANSPVADGGRTT